MTTAGLADRSRAAFTQRFPQIITALDVQEPQSAAIFDGASPVDLMVGERQLYGGDARSQAGAQVEAFMAKPLRLIMETPNAAGLVSEICIGLKLAMDRSLVEERVSELSRGPLTAPTFLIVFGVGLGYHLEELIRRTGARWVVIVEPFVEFIGHSFGAVDWQALFERVEGAGGKIEMITEMDPSQIVTLVMNHVARNGTPYLDGSWVFTHYPHWTFAEAGKRLHGAAEFVYVNRGFFEDELVMMTNATTNFAKHPFWLLDMRPRRHRPELAVIVGAGPSLDEAVDTLRRIRDRVVLFSGGTALRPLLRHGIVPDFHCELENGPQVPEVIAEAAQYGDLSRIRLIASATVDPRTPALFKETILFFRDTVSSTRILAGEIVQVSGAAPTCINTAVAAATALGFTDFAFFGTDCGTRSDVDDHAEGTIYRDLDKWKSKAALRTRYPLEVEGNFGGIAITNWVYDASRRMLIDLIAVHRLNAVNCSDGALIAGATPRVPESVRADGPALDRDALIATIKRTMVQYAPGEILREKDLPGLRQKSRDMYQALRDILAEADPEAADFAAVFDGMMKFLREAQGRFAYAEAIPDGSLSALPRIAMFYGCRIADLALRRRLFATFRAEFETALDAMDRETDALLERLAKLLDEPPASVAGRGGTQRAAIGG
jgi:Glycosyltransferase Maf N-terminal domain/Protein of unknown function DUF115